MWVNNFRTRGALRVGVAKGGIKTVRTPENMERDGEAMDATSRRYMISFLLS